MSYKMIVCDFDDTLVGSDMTLSEEDKKAIRLATEKGVIFTIATGRMFSSILPYAKELGVECPIMCCQGAVIRKCPSGEWISFNPIPCETAKEVLKFARENNYYAQVHTPDTFHYAHDNQYSRRYTALCGYEGVEVGQPLDEWLTFDPAKILFISETERINEVLPIARGKWDSLEIATSKPIYLEVTDKSSNKGNAVAALAEKLGISMDEVICIGDGTNDISMIQRAGLGIAVANAAQPLLDAADYITASQKESGVAKAIYKFVL